MNPKISLLLSLILVIILIFEFYIESSSNKRTLIRLRKALLIAGILVVGINYWDNINKESISNRDKLNSQAMLLENAIIEMQVNIEFIELMHQELDNYYSKKGFIGRRLQHEALLSSINSNCINDHLRQAVKYTSSKIEEMNKFMDAISETSGKDRKTNIDGLKQINQVVFSNLVNIKDDFQQKKDSLNTIQIDWIYLLKKKN